MNDDVNFINNFPEGQKAYQSPDEALKKLFGFDSFKTGQRDVIGSILSGRDTFAVMPTGAGKSLCYQIPAMLFSGITLVISPLISLMQDQVKALKEAGISAAFLNSSLSEAKFSEAIQLAGQGYYKIIYVAPERLLTDRFINLARSIDISMVTVDEAHCISQWGQDFRPSYMKIVEFISLLGKRPVISAFTATATEIVRDDVICTLGLIDPYVLVTGFNRENLFFQVEKPKDKDQYVLDYVDQHIGDSGIIYCSTRKNVDSLYDLMISRGIPAAKYHAGMSQEERKKMQDDFVFDFKGIIVATNAFGMGIDKSNVRFVIHYNMPQSMENYYQEAGRAGRDGLDSKCIILFSPQDIIINRFLLEHKEMTDMDPEDMKTVMERDTKRLQVMVNYCYTTECLRNYILNYFGEKTETPCGDCGNCLKQFETVDLTSEAKQIINCVYEARGRYGASIIMDTLLGANTARLREVGAVSYKSYGALSSQNKNILKRLIGQMTTEGYLVVGDYQVLKMGDISRLRNPETRVLIKITDEDKPKEKSAKAKKSSRGSGSILSADLTSAGFKLFENLKKLRLEIAREESVPPYIVFSDRSLMDMSSKVPTCRDEMMDVSGVGENKYARYGERFIVAIEEFCGYYPELINNKTVGFADADNNQGTGNIAGHAGASKIGGFAGASASGANKSGKKRSFYLFREEADNFTFAKYMYVSEIKDEMNRICSRDDVKKMTPTVLYEVLMENELIIEKNIDGRTVKEPTEHGSDQGIKIVNKVAKSGLEYTLLVYPEKIQRLLIEHFITN